MGACVNMKIVFLVSPPVVRDSSVLNLKLNREETASVWMSARVQIHPARRIHRVLQSRLNLLMNFPRSPLTIQQLNNLHICQLTPPLQSRLNRLTNRPRSPLTIQQLNNLHTCLTPRLQILKKKQQRYAPSSVVFRTSAQLVTKQKLRRILCRRFVAAETLILI